MKKSKLSLCLASGFVAAMSLAACGNGVTSNESAIVTIKDSNGKEINLLTSAIYDEYKKSSSGVSKFYNAILEALIRYEYENPNSAIADWGKSAKALKSKAEIKEEAENNVKNDKRTANSRAKTNNSSYETEWENILSSHNCLPKDGDSESGEEKLLQYYIYQLEKEDMADKFFLFEKDQLTKEWLGVTNEGKEASSIIKGVFPYHIRHVLVSLSGGASNFYDGTISSDEAKDLGDTMEALLNTKYSFGDVAKFISPDDPTSAALSGDLGIMTTTTSFVNEFKLGIYAFDSIYTHQDDEAQDVIRHGVGLDADFTFELKNAEGTIETTNPIDAFQTKLNNGKIQEVPYDAFLRVKTYAEDTKDYYGKLVNDGNEHYYPRNVLYNYYLNFHNPFVITRELISTSNGLPIKDETGKYEDRFTTIYINGEDKDVLCDEKGNVIIGVRSQHGIHFMVMEKSIYDYSVAAGGDVATLEEYYTTAIPSDTAYPKTPAGDNKDTYIDFIDDEKEWDERSSKVKSEIKSFDSTYDYRLFDYILKVEGSNISIKDDTLKLTVADYISRTRVANYNDASKTLNEAWRSYAELIALQYNNRTEWDDVQTTTKDFRTIHPRCAVGFKSHSGTAWDHNGVCHYDK